MKKSFFTALLVCLVFLLTGCNLNFNKTSSSSPNISTDISTSIPINETTSIPTNIPSTSLENITTSTDINISLENEFIKLKSIKYATIIEKTKVSKDNNIYLASRTTNVDLNNNYYYGEFSSLSSEGTLQYSANSFYYKLSNDSSVKNYYETNDIFRTVGISDLLDTSLNYKKKTSTSYQITLTNDVTRFENVFDNINIDFGTKYNYNPCLLKATLDFSKDGLSKITIDASLAFGSYYNEAIREITISYDTFEIHQFDLSSGTKYYTNVGDKLDTYVLEMIYQYGDSIYIHSGDFDMLIDAGQQDDGANVNNILKDKCLDNKLEVLIATHGHQDHLGGFTTGALNSITDVDLIIDYGYTGGNTDYGYERYRNYYSNCDYYSAYDCVNLKNGASKLYKFSDDLSLEVLNTGAYQESGTELHRDCNDENEHSVVVKLTFKDHTYLYTGDISGNYESYLEKEDIQNITVYKASHHGAQTKNSNSASFLKYVNPEIAVVSAAIVYSDNIFDSAQAHPTRTFVSRILATSKIKQTKNLYYNGTMGTIHLSDDGKNEITVTGFGPTKGYLVDGVKVTGEDNKKFVDTKFYELKY